jgi:hypothetical protein
LRTDSESEAFARVLTFSASRERLSELREQVYQSLQESVFDADADSKEASHPVEASIALCVVEVPKNADWRVQVGVEDVTPSSK